MFYSCKYPTPDRCVSRLIGNILILHVPLYVSFLYASLAAHPVISASELKPIISSSNNPFTNLILAVIYEECRSAVPVRMEITR